ncbi:hypothetical protein MN202_07150 [Rheinheimera muenzenbergensis]|uniref:CVNH domain-containing protein n=1 Tax=Rheinheimera muenzenbergensis TaxID=1193628 RepID=A0ABU8C5P1_9GAMM
MKLYLLILSLSWSGLIWAADKDQALTIVAEQVDGKHCIKEIAAPANDNCKQADGSRDKCDGIKNCVCGKADKHIEWQSADITDYTVYFYAQSPFKDNCKLTSNNRGKLKCRIKGDAEGSYDYGVKVPGCADFDPRIIVKQN